MRFSKSAAVLSVLVVLGTSAGDAWAQCAAGNQGQGPGGRALINQQGGRMLLRQPGGPAMFGQLNPQQQLLIAQQGQQQQQFALIQRAQQMALMQQLNQGQDAAILAAQLRNQAYQRRVLLQYAALRQQAQEGAKLQAEK